MLYCVVVDQGKILNVLLDVLLQDMVLPSRVIHLPMSFDDKWVADALEKYTKGVRQDAPYLPNNVDYIAANNALTSREDVSAYNGSCTSWPSCQLAGMGDVFDRHYQ